MIGIIFGPSPGELLTEASVLKPQASVNLFKIHFRSFKSGIKSASTKSWQGQIEDGILFFGIFFSCPIAVFGLTKIYLFAIMLIIMKTTTKNTAFFAKLNNSAIIGIIIIALVMRSG